MIQKVLIAEDHQSTNLSLHKTLEELGIIDVHYVYYCDDALLKVKKAVEVGAPYDLLITDLYFDADLQKQALSGGAELIAAAREAQADLRVLVFSAEGKIATIESLYTGRRIDGYVRKGRHDATELKQAVARISGNERYFPRFYVQAARQENVFDFKPYDITIISRLASGMRLKDIPGYLRVQGIRPDGLSSLEKRLKQIRAALNFSSNEQLVAYCVEQGLV
jgi:DNA-binding NarL/FixJ family response regulator